MPLHRTTILRRFSERWAESWLVTIHVLPPTRCVELDLSRLTMYHAPTWQDTHTIFPQLDVRVIDYASPGTDPPEQGWVTADMWWWNAEQPSHLVDLLIEYATLVRQYVDGHGTRNHSALCARQCHSCYFCVHVANGYIAFPKDLALSMSKRGNVKPTLYLQPIV